MLKLLQNLVSCKGLEEETAREKMVSYVTGTCSQVVKTCFEIHCLTCAECRFKLAIILRLLHSPADDEEEKVLASLFTLGLEAASKARSMVCGEGKGRRKGEAR